MNDYWYISSKENTDFVACMDEKPYQLLDSVREPLLMSFGDNQKIDFEYKRNRICNIFAFAEPLSGNHHVNVHEHHTAIDWVKEIKYLSDEMFPETEKIILVMDNINTHKASSLCKAFEPTEARRIIKRFEYSKA